MDNLADLTDRAIIYHQARLARLTRIEPLYGHTLNDACLRGLRRCIFAEYATLIGLGMPSEEAGALLPKVGAV